jgi:hypothetical protein
MATSCNAPPASTAAAWLQLGLELQHEAPERARACFAANAAGYHPIARAVIEPLVR